MVKLVIVEQKTLEKNNKATLKRIADKHVGYMEISETAKGFACGACRSLNTEGFCQNPDVKAYVSADHGCCNYFYPKQAKIVFPKEEKGDGKSS